MTMIKLLITRLTRHAFMAGYEAALNNATQEMDGKDAWPHYTPPSPDWCDLENRLDRVENTIGKVGWLFK